MKKMAASWLIALAPVLGHSQGIPLNTTSGGDIGLEISGRSYESERNGAFEESIKGRKLGLVGSFTQAYDNQWFWGGEGRIATGATSLDSRNSISLGQRSGDPETTLELRLTAGLDIATGNQMLSPYAGLGYQSTTSYLKGYTSLNGSSTTRGRDLVYIPLGVTHRAVISETARFATTFEYDLLLDADQQTYYTDFVGGTQDLQTSHSKGYGARLRFAYETARWSTSLFYHHWRLDASPAGTFVLGGTVYSTTHPENVVRELGLQLRYRFH